MPVAAEREVKLFDPRMLASYDASRVPISFQIRADDPRFFPDFDQWKHEPVGINVGARTVSVRADVFKDATRRVPFKESSMGVHNPASHVENKAMYTPSPDNLPKPMSPWMVLGAGLGLMGDAALGLMAAKSKNKAAISSWLLLQAPIINGCQSAMVTPSAEVTQVPAEVTIVAPATPKVEATTTPQPQNSTENAPGGPAEPTLVSSTSWPSPDLFPKTLPNREVIPQSEIKAENVLDQFGDIDYTLRYYGKKATLGFVETASGQYQWAIEATTNGGKSALWPKNADGTFFSHPSTANDQDTSASTPVAGYDVITPTGINQDYKLGLESANGVFTYVARSTKDGAILASFFVTPGLEGEWKLVTAPATEVAKFSIDSLELAPEVAAALKKHPGLEASITPEAGGFTTQITYWDANHNLVTEKVNVDPSTLTENTQISNKFADTSVMTTAEGKKLYWIQEEKGWYQVEISHNIDNPVFIPYDKREIAVRVVIAEYGDPFSQDAINWWNKSSGVLGLAAEYLNINTKTGESTKFGYLSNQAMGDADTNIKNSPVQGLDTWWITNIDGADKEFFFMKWLDPVNPRDPKGNEWKVILCASGSEIMSDPVNRAKFHDLFVKTFDPKSRLQVLPVFSAQDEFFNKSTPMFSLNVLQPSLDNLDNEAEKSLGALSLPSEPETKFSSWIKDVMDAANAGNPSVINRYGGKNDTNWDNGFFPQDIQTIIFPAIIAVK